MAALGVAGAGVAGDYAVLTAVADYAAADGRLRNTKEGWLRDFVIQVDRTDPEIPTDE